MQSPYMHRQQLITVFSIPRDLGFLPEHSLGMFSMQHLEVLPRSQIKLCILMPPSFWGVRFGYRHFSLPQFLVYWARKTSHVKWGEVMTVWLGKDWDPGNVGWCARIKQFKHNAMWQMVFKECSTFQCSRSTFAFCLPILQC